MNAKSQSRRYFNSAAASVSAHSPWTECRRYFIAAVLLIMLTPALATACSCAFTNSACDIDWKRREVVFLGKVTAKDSPPNQLNNADYRLSGRIGIHFSVTESFHGGVTAGQAITVYTGVGGGDCGYPFIVGTTYLVYAFNHQNQLTTSICTQTRPEVTAAGIMRALRAVRDGEQPAVLFGTIGIGPRGVSFEDLVESKALGGIRVQAVGSKAQEYLATTDEQGVYSFDWLPPDTYRLEIDLPTGLSTSQRNSGKQLIVRVGPGEDAFGCRADVFARPDGRISGIVVDAGGRNVAGFVTIKPADPKEAEAASRRGGLPGFTTEDGKFSLWQIPPGRYRLLFYPKINGQLSFVRAFQSDVIDLTFGQNIESFRFEVPIPN